MVFQPTFKSSHTMCYPGFFLNLDNLKYAYLQRQRLHPNYYLQGALRILHNVSNTMVFETLWWAKGYKTFDNFLRFWVFLVLVFEVSYLWYILLLFKLNLPSSSQLKKYFSSILRPLEDMLSNVIVFKLFLLFQNGHFGKQCWEACFCLSKVLV